MWETSEGMLDIVSSHLANCPCSPADVNFERVRLFYARPSLLPHNRTIAVGLPPKRTDTSFYDAKPSSQKITPDIFHIFRPPKKVKTDNNIRAQMEHARHLAKYVFPREYGLPSVFDTRGPSGTGYLDREEQVIVRRCLIRLLTWC